jgi:hypothetical protein
MTVAALKGNQSQKRNSFPFNWLQKGLYQKSTQGGWKIKKAKRKRANQHCTGSPGQAVAPNIERRPRQTSEWVIFGVCVLGERTSSSGRPGIGDCGRCS